MGDLTGLSLKTAYHKGEDDIATEFYLPCMFAASKYDRAVGFFSSTIYVIAWPSLRDFIGRGGKIRIVCSPVLSSGDAEALREGYSARAEATAAEALRGEVSRLLADPFLSKPTRVVASLVAIGALDVQVAFLKKASDPKGRRIFHDKTGIFTDTMGHSVVFKGSMNETWTGLAADGNIESVDVYVSWLDAREASRVQKEIDYFQSLWKNVYPAAVVKRFPEIAQEELLRAAEPKNWPELVEEICQEMEAASRLSADRVLGGRTPLPHQARAIEEWVARGRRGILEHATGSGKTFTALCAIRDAIGRGEIPLVLVPSELLLHQWLAELRTTLADIQPEILPCGAGHARWRDERLLRPWTRSRADAKPRIVLSTMQTAAREEFRHAVAQGSHLFLVADEVHRMGSQEHQRLFGIESGPRLGLSATPRRAGDPAGTAAILQYFNGIVPPPFTLDDAIRANALTPYFYAVSVVSLNAEEQTRWGEITRQIARLVAQHSGDGDQRRPLVTNDQRVKHLLIQRSRIVKGAAAKVPAAARILAHEFHEGQRWIVYCDSQDQMSAVLASLHSAGLPASEYHSEMRGDRQATLRHFEMNGGILVSIRCLDEGVDIPAVSHALILASSQNPREFVQRRGRVLRKYPGKTLAYLYDVVVVPAAAPEADESPELAILYGELARAVQFGRSAHNPSAVTELERIAARFGITARFMEGGFEDDE